MDKYPNIADSEYEIMQVIWEIGPVKSSEIIERIMPKTGWSEKTIKTLINRLLNKGAIGFNKDGRAYEYYPIIEKQCYTEKENNSFLERVYKGSLSSMFSAFIKNAKLSKSEIEELKKILEEEE